MKQILLISILFIFLFINSSFSMTAKEARLISNKNHNKLFQKCQNTVLKELDSYIEEASKDGRFQTCTYVDNYCESVDILTDSFILKIQHYFEDKGFHFYQRVEDDRWLCVAWHE